MNCQNLSDTMLEEEKRDIACIKKDFNYAYNLFLSTVELNTVQVHLLDYVIDLAGKTVSLEGL